MLVSFLHSAKEVLAPILDPFHRAADELCGRRHGDIFGVDAKLRTEAAADIGGRNPQAVLIHAERRRKRIEKIMRLLGRCINRHSALPPAGLYLEKPAP